MIELRSPSGRGHWITTVLKGLASLQKQPGVFLGISSTLGVDHPEKKLFDAALPILREGGMVILDDADVASRPEKLRASRMPEKISRVQGTTHSRMHHNLCVC